VERSAPGRPSSDQQVPDLVEKQERINILLLGIDQRENDPGPWRTDTMILVSIDPATESVAMLSIPRDLWVTIPGFGEDRINTAHMKGDAQDYPGGGPALAKKTVWFALGVPVDYYVRVNFSGFEKIIDEIGGITINVEEAIHDEEYPDGNYGTMVIDIPAGEQHMDGVTALQYARSRHETSDYDRMERQQKVILAAREKVLSLDIPVSRIPALIEAVGDSVQTDLALNDILHLADILRNVDAERIEHDIINNGMTTTVITPDHKMVEVPDWEQVRQLVDTLFPAPVPSAVPSPSLITDRIQEEAATVLLQNGTLVPNLAQTTAETLTAKGFDVVDYDNADRFDHADTLIVAYTTQRYTVQALADALNVATDHIYFEDDAPDDVTADIVVILGRDHAQSSD
jgi:LCP family protein required for cell wall assembly